MEYDDSLFYLIEDIENEDSKFANKDISSIKKKKNEVKAKVEKEYDSFYSNSNCDFDPKSTFAYPDASEVPMFRTSETPAY